MELIAYRRSEHGRLSGIYKITCVPTGKFYIGSTYQFAKRKNEHYGALQSNRHINRRLQNAWNKYGKDNFRFEIVEFCPKEDMLDREQFYFDILRPFDRGVGFNLCSLAVGGGLEFTEDHRRKLSISAKGKKVKRSSIKKALETRSKYSPDMTSKWYEFARPDGGYVGCNTIAWIAKEFNLSEKCLSCVYRGETKQHKGWRPWNALTAYQPYKPYPPIREPYSQSNHKLYDSHDNHITVTNLAEFCRQHSLSTHSMYGVTKGTVREHRGYSLLPKAELAEERRDASRRNRERPRCNVDFVSPDGEIVNVTNIAQWCKRNGFHIRSIYRIMNGERATYKGWKYLGGTRSSARPKTALAKESCPKGYW